MKKVDFDDLGFSFEVEFDTTVTVRDKTYPKINMKEVRAEAFLHLMEPLILTGDQIRFIRKYMNLTQEALGLCLGVTITSSNVNCWENKNENPAGIPSHLQDQLIVLMDSYVKAEADV